MSTPAIYSGKEILIAYINKVRGLNITEEDIDFSTPQRNDSPNPQTNTTVRLYPKLGTPYTGSPKIEYDRVHISQLGLITIERGHAGRLYALLDAINEKYQLKITEEDVEDEIFLPTNQGEITIGFKPKPTSVTYYDGPIIYTPHFPNHNLIPPNKVAAFGFWSEARSANDVALSNSNLTAQMDNHSMAVCSIPVTANPCYWEIEILSDSLIIGVSREPITNYAASGTVVANDSSSIGLNTLTGMMRYNTSSIYYCPPIPTGSIVGVLLDVPGNAMHFIVNGVLYGNVAYDMSTHQAWYPVVSGTGTTRAEAVANFGALPMRWSPPAGFNHGVYLLKEDSSDTGGACIPGTFTLDGGSANTVYYDGSAGGGGSSGG